MPKYRPVEGRGIEDARAGDLIGPGLSYAWAARVVAVNGNFAWLQKDGHNNQIWDFQDLNVHKFQIVEPIPEPKIEHIFFSAVKTRVGWVGDESKKMGDKLDGVPVTFVLKLTRTDGKITAVELVKEES